MKTYLAHHGVKGQKWGVKNGPPYPIGSSPRKVFISGTWRTSEEGSPYERKMLPKAITDKVDSYMKDNCHILIGDAPGIDTQVQNYLAKKGYKNVTVYTISDKPRHYSDKNGKLGWGIKNVDGKEQVDKDKAMSKDAHMGFAVILEDGATATRNNIERMDQDGKDVEVFSLTKDGNDHFVYTKRYEVPTDRPHSDYNVDKWGTSEDTNCLFVTGFSGSGKSTLAVKMAKEDNAELLVLDAYMTSTDKPISNSWTNWRNESFNKYLDKHYPQWHNDKNKAFKTHKNMGDYFDKMERQILNYSKSMYGKKKIIAEGIQIMDDTFFYKNKEFLKDKPVIIMNTDITQAYMSAISRDKIKVSEAIDSERIDWYGSMFSDMQYLNKILKTPMSSI